MTNLNDMEEAVTLAIDAVCEKYGTPTPYGPGHIDIKYPHSLCNRRFVAISRSIYYDHTKHGSVEMMMLLSKVLDDLLIQYAFEAKQNDCGCSGVSIYVSDGVSILTKSYT